MRRNFLRRFLVALLGLCALSLLWSFLRPRVVAPLPQLTIEVLNGSGVDRLGAAWAERLRGLGQDVVRVADADRADHARTFLVDRRGRRRLAARLGRELGGIPTVLEAIEDAEVDLTLILGADHQHYE